jgi:site-specific recombinase XerC
VLPRRTAQRGDRVRRGLRVTADPHVGAELAEQAERAIAGSSAYRSAWRLFRGWCRERGLTALPATQETLVTYIAHRHRVEGNVAATLEVALNAVLKAHKAVRLASPTSEALRAIVAEARRHAPRPTSLPLEDVRAVVHACGDDAAGLRDRALLLTIHHGRLSRVRAIRLDVDHLARPELAALRQPHPEPVLCPVVAIERWLAARGNPPSGPLFVSIHGIHGPRFGRRLSPGDVHRILCLRCDAAGIRRVRTSAFRLPPLPPSTSKEPFR